MKANIDIRKLLIVNDLKVYEIAYHLNIEPSNLSRLLRRELTEEKKKTILKAIEELSNKCCPKCKWLLK